MKKNNPKKGFPRQNFLKKKLGGFTLVEILVVTSIVILLSALIFPNYRAGEKQFALLRSAYKLANDIRRVGEITMSAKVLPKQTIIQYVKGNFNFGWLFPRCSCDRDSTKTECPFSFSAQPTDPSTCYDQFRWWWWGKRSWQYSKTTQTFPEIVPPGYGVYLKQGDDYYLIYADTDPADGNERYNSGDQIIDTLSLEKGVKIKSVVGDNNDALDNLSINFKPPDPTVKLSSGTKDYSQVIITLSLKDDESKTRVIRVNRLGLIDID